MAADLKRCEILQNYGKKINFNVRLFFAMGIWKFLINY